MQDYYLFSQRCRRFFIPKIRFPASQRCYQLKAGGNGCFDFIQNGNFQLDLPNLIQMRKYKVLTGIAFYFLWVFLLKKGGMYIHAGKII